MISLLVSDNGMFIFVVVFDYSLHYLFQISIDEIDHCKVVSYQIRHNLHNEVIGDTNVLEFSPSWSLVFCLLRI